MKGLQSTLSAPVHWLFSRKNRAPVGTRPGTLSVSEQAMPTHAWRTHYDTSTVQRAEYSLPAHDDAAAEPGLTKADDAPGAGVAWFDVRGLRDLDLLKHLGDMFGVHPLALEDVVNIPQRPKLDLYPGDPPQYFGVFRQVSLNDDLTLEVRQVSLVVGSGFVVSFLESDTDLWEPILQRLEEGLGPIRRAGSDYLAYALIDIVIDGYYPVLETLAERLEELEERILNDPQPSVLQQLQRIKRQLLLLRRAVWPQREALSRVLRDHSGVFGEEASLYLKDTLDHVVQIADVIESCRDLVGELTNTYLTMISNRMNEVMKVLTIMASIFIPLTFIAGVYGMNFESMPELRVKWAYPLVLGTMVITAGVMVAYFRRKGWIGGGSSTRRRD